MTFQRPSAEILATATPEELADLAAECLSGLEIGRQPFPLFRQLRRLVVMSTVELVPIHRASAKPKVLLGQRPSGPEEPWWGGQLNLPGSVLLPNEQIEDYHDLANPTDRILKTEFAGTVSRISDLHVFDRGLTKHESGTENKTWGWIEVKLNDGYDQPDGGDFYDIEEVIVNPPMNLVEGHAQTIQLGLQAYQSFQTQLS